MPRDPASISTLGNIHHQAFRCRDAEETRKFWADMLGLKLGAALDFDHIFGTDSEALYMHLFFEMGDGNFIAFFDVPDTATEEMFQRKDGMDVHVALETESYEQLLEWKEHIHEVTGRTVMGPIDHDFVHSIYFFDPNGLRVEITTKDKNYDAIMSKKAAESDDAMKRWSEKTASIKAERLGFKST